VPPWAGKACKEWSLECFKKQSKEKHCSPDWSSKRLIYSIDWTQDNIRSLRNFSVKMGQKD